MQPDNIPALETVQSGQVVNESAGFINKTFSFDVGNFQIAPTYWQAGLIIFLLFVLVLTLARLRHIYLGWSLNSFLPAVFLGFVLTLVFEGFLILGGKTLLTEILGWEDAPKPISTALDEGKVKLIQVLGVSDEVPGEEKDYDYKDVINIYESLDQKDKDKVNSYMCAP